jgi:hypothetical protein
MSNIGIYAIPQWILALLLDKRRQRCVLKSFLESLIQITAACACRRGSSAVTHFRICISSSFLNFSFGISTFQATASRVPPVFGLATERHLEVYTRACGIHHDPQFCGIATSFKRLHHKFQL